ncbi:MAG: GNAT family N-acetyltransferase [Nitratireductor sp.]
MMNFKKHLEDNKFSLIQLEPSHFDALYSVASDPKVWEQHPQKDRWKRDVFENLFEDALANELGCFAIKDKEQNKLVGWTRFYAHDASEPSIKIGYTFIAPHYWGSATNAQVKKLLLDYTFNYMNTVYFDVGKHNLRSRKAVEKLGATLFQDAVEGNVTYVLLKANYTL